MNTTTLMLTAVATTLSISFFSTTNSEASLILNGSSLTGSAMNIAPQRTQLNDGPVSTNGLSLNGIYANKLSQQGTQVDGLD